MKLSGPGFSVSLLGDYRLGDSWRGEPWAGEYLPGQLGHVSPGESGLFAIVRNGAPIQNKGHEKPLPDNIPLFGLICAHAALPRLTRFPVGPAGLVVETSAAVEAGCPVAGVSGSDARQRSGESLANAAV
jgi:hypothetical protein